MPFAGGQPPGPHAGDMSPQTQVLRPRIRLTAEQCEAARKLRRSGQEIIEIAAYLAAPAEEISLALATLRTRKRFATRRSLNVTLAAHEYVVGEAEAGEACWETVDRLLAELAFRRAFAGATVSRGR